MSYNRLHLCDTLVQFIKVDDLLNISCDHGLVGDIGERVKINMRLTPSRVACILLKEYKLKKIIEWF